MRWTGLCWRAGAAGGVMAPFGACCKDREGSSTYQQSNRSSPSGDTPLGTYPGALRLGLLRRPLLLLRALVAARPGEEGVKKARRGRRGPQKRAAGGRRGEHDYYSKLPAGAWSNRSIKSVC